MEEERLSSSLLRQKLKSSICLAGCCFGGHQETMGTSAALDKPRTLRWSPEFRGKSRNILARRAGRSRRHSSDFSYDPLSYALNFDEGTEEDRTYELPLRNFAARLPPSPPRAANRVQSPSLVAECCR
ncbi:uncharacterized protein LOC131151407 [Malania oleifera]|uniref:uncharacterized protein LOC131151407 n=1 Tax=Malania oleifera TaxID=397392 RepID=UPI0025AE9D0F|nr:uncharacterized protein LOC131151407 [Malania oleifera]